MTGRGPPDRAVWIARVTGGAGDTGVSALQIGSVTEPARGGTSGKRGLNILAMSHTVGPARLGVGIRLVVVTIPATPVGDTAVVVIAMTGPTFGERFRGGRTK